jgi:uncharacterized protein (TIGR03067 family)
MPWRRTRVGWALGLLLLAGAELRAQEVKIEGDLKTMQGEWAGASQGGGEVLYTIKANKLQVKAPTREYTMTMTLDPKAKPEKALGLKIDQGPDDAKGMAVQAIYKLEGEDKLVICFRLQGRPEKFEEQGFEQFVLDLKRKKK